MTGRNRRQKIVAIAAIATVVIIAVAAGLYLWTEQPSFCGGCHEMATVYSSWAYSTHGNIADCLDCHAEPGTGNRIIAHLNGARYIWQKITGQAEGQVFRTDLSDSSCTHCHPLDELEDTQQDIAVKHRIHNEDGVECENCHENLVHRTFRAVEVRPPVIVCEDCHQERGITVDEDIYLGITDPLGRRLQ